MAVRLIVRFGVVSEHVGMAHLVSNELNNALDRLVAKPTSMKGLSASRGADVRKLGEKGLTISLRYHKRIDRYSGLLGREFDALWARCTAVLKAVGNDDEHLRGRREGLRRVRNCCRDGFVDQRRPSGST